MGKDGDASSSKSGHTSVSVYVDMLNNLKHDLDKLKGKVKDLTQEKEEMSGVIKVQEK